MNGFLTESWQRSQSLTFSKPQIQTSALFLQRDPKLENQFKQILFLFTNIITSVHTREGTTHFQPLEAFYISFVLANFLLAKKELRWILHYKTGIKIPLPYTT